MGKKSKGSRKGKKAWRANISTADIEDFFDKSTKDSLSGGSLSAFPSDSLFVVDKSRDLSVKRKIEKKRDKVLYSDSILKKNPFVQPVPSSINKKSKKQPEGASKAKETSQDGARGGMFDLWDDNGEDKCKISKKPKSSIIPAVEVEPPGCSFNPSHESHQDILAHAVAEEMQKVYRNELGPEPVPLTVPGEVLSEEDMLFLDADRDTDEEMNLDEMDQNENNESEKRPLKMRRVTRVELNKRARHKEQLKKEAKAKKLEGISKEIDSLVDIIQEIAKEDEERHRRHIRRTIAKQERLKSCPPRLGKHKFGPAPVQVLLAEEITGSLRKLKGCCTLLKDRFKSLEKRGIIVPTAKSRRK
ncbi:ribosome biogenesis protein NOP53-like isoform X2 [Momordica charantia]|uniref:Ribosome biogenesis protein NOP53 n=1 Tax=Momordica charantia TaxID=3673 RepID=A0A6J1DPW4_MOMCH|nr:ribosome biogenesis protein NOP53-like isoform X2 [Momordica charantia]